MNWNVRKQWRHYSVNFKKKYNNLWGNELMETLLEFDGIKIKKGLFLVIKMRLNN